MGQYNDRERQAVPYIWCNCNVTLSLRVSVDLSIENGRPLVDIPVSARPPIHTYVRPQKVFRFERKRSMRAKY